MFELFVESHFSAAHHLENYPGNCARWHGHNWHVTVFLQTAELNDLSMAVDFRELKSALRSVLETLDHRDLNDVPGFKGLNPTCEVVARYIYRQLAAAFTRPDLRVARVRVSETPGAGATYWE